MLFLEILASYLILRELRVSHSSQKRKHLARAFITILARSLIRCRSLLLDKLRKVIVLIIKRTMTWCDYILHHRIWRRLLRMLVDTKELSLGLLYLNFFGGMVSWN